MAYNRYLNSVNNYNNQELEIESLVNQDKTVFHQKVEESIAKFTDLALGLHASAEMIKGLHGIYGKYKQKVLKKLKNATDDDLEDVGLNPEKIRPFQKWREMKEMGGRQIAPEDIARVRGGETFRSVMPDYDETSLSTRALPAEVRQAPEIVRPEVPEIRPAPAREPADLADLLNVDDADADPDPYGMAGLAERVAKQKALYPEAFEPQFSGPVAPRGFGQEVEAPKPQLREWDEPSVRRLPTVQEARPIEPAVLRGKEEIKPITRAERLEARKRFRQLEAKRLEEEPDFKYHPVSQGEHEFKMGVKSKLSDQFADLEGVERLPDPKSEYADILPDVEDISEQPLPRGAPTGAIADVAEDMPTVVADIPHQAQGYRISRAFMKGRKRLSKKLARQQARQQAREQAQQPQQPEPERPLTPSQEITPVREDTPRVVQPDVVEARPSPAVREGDILPEETPKPRVAEGFSEMSDAPSTTAKVGADIGETVGDVGEDLAFTALDAVPVLGQLSALGMGIYSMIEAFKPHHAPKEKIIPTGVSFNPEGEMSGSGYV